MRNLILGILFLSSPVFAGGIKVVPSVFTNVTVNGNTTINGNTTLGDASGDIATLNASSVTFVNDTNVSLQGGVAGLNFGVNGTFTTLSLDATNGRIGVGTQAPIYDIHASVNAGAARYTTMENTSTTGYAAFRARGNAGDPESFDMVLGGSGTGDIYADFGTFVTQSGLTGIQFATNGANRRLVIDNSGNVSIGNDTTPDATLDVISNAAATAFALSVSSQNGNVMFGVQGNGLTVVNEDGAAAGDFRAEGDTNANMIFLDASGDAVGFGTGSPGANTVTSSLPVVISSAAGSSLATAQDAAYTQSFFKAYASIENSAGTPSINFDMNISSVTDTAVGQVTISFERDFADTNYICFVINTENNTMHSVQNKQIQSARVHTFNISGTEVDVDFDVACIGDQ